MKVNRAFKFQFLKICLFKTKHFYSLNLSISSVKISSSPQKNPQVGIPSGWDPVKLFEKNIWFLHENVYSSQKKLVIFQAYDPIIKYLRNTSLKTFSSIYSTIFYLINASSLKGICGETGYFFNIEFSLNRLRPGLSSQSPWFYHDFFAPNVKGFHM